MNSYYLKIFTFFFTVFALLTPSLTASSPPFYNTKTKCNWLASQLATCKTDTNNFDNFKICLNESVKLPQEIVSNFNFEDYEKCTNESECFALVSSKSLCVNEEKDARWDNNNKIPEKQTAANRTFTTTMPANTNNENETLVRVVNVLFLTVVVPIVALIALAVWFIIKFGHVGIHMGSMSPVFEYRTMFSVFIFFAAVFISFISTKIMDHKPNSATALKVFKTLSAKFDYSDVNYCAKVFKFKGREAFERCIKSKNMPKCFEMETLRLELSDFDDFNNCGSVSKVLKAVSEELDYACSRTDPTVVNEALYDELIASNHNNNPITFDFSIIPSSSSKYLWDKPLIWGLMILGVLCIPAIVFFTFYRRNRLGRDDRLNAKSLDSVEKNLNK